MKKVLIVEDDRSLLTRIVKFLGKYQDQFEVVPASDGQEAIEILRDQSVSLVVTDIQMPNVNGLKLLAYINNYYAYVPCFVMTAYSTSRLKAKLPGDLLRFFEKPFEIEDLAKAIVAALDRDVESYPKKTVSLLNFLTLIEMYQASCRFDIEVPNKTPGSLYFNNGILYDAICGDLTGETAALKLLSRKTPIYSPTFSSQKEIVRRITTDLRDLIRNVTGSIDETPQGT